MDQEILDKLMLILGRKTTKQKEIAKFKKAKQNTKVTLVIIKTESGKLNAIIPEGMHVTSYHNALERFNEKIEAFKCSNEKLIRI